LTHSGAPSLVFKDGVRKGSSGSTLSSGRRQVLAFRPGGQRVDIGWPFFKEGANVEKYRECFGTYVPSIRFGPWPKDGNAKVKRGEEKLC